MALIGCVIGFKIRTVEVMWREQQPLTIIREGFTIFTITVVFTIRYFPVTNQFWLEFELAIFHGIISGVNEVDDAGTDVCRKHFNSGCNHVNGFVGVAYV